jgi:hypothetical protein
LSSSRASLGDDEGDEEDDDEEEEEARKTAGMGMANDEDEDGPAGKLEDGMACG